MGFINHVKGFTLSLGSFLLQKMSYCKGNRKLPNESYWITRIGFSSKPWRDTSYLLNYLSNLRKPGVVKWNLVIAFLGRISKVGKWDQLHKPCDSVVCPFQHLPPSSSSILFGLLNNHLPQVVYYHRFQRDSDPQWWLLTQGVRERQASCKRLEDHCDRSLHSPQGCLGKSDSVLTWLHPEVPRRHPVKKKKVGEMFQRVSSFQSSRKREGSTKVSSFSTRPSVTEALQMMLKRQ